MWKQIQRITREQNTPQVPDWPQRGACVWGTDPDSATKALKAERTLEPQTQEVAGNPQLDSDGPAVLSQHRPHADSPRRMQHLTPPGYRPRMCNKQKTRGISNHQQTLRTRGCSRWSELTKS